jgi:hypothetical protein
LGAILASRTIETPPDLEGFVPSLHDAIRWLLEATTLPAAPFVFGDQILLIDQNDNDDPLGPRSTVDLCPACSNTPGSAHIDMYNSSQVCQGVPSFGTRTVIRMR